MGTVTVNGRSVNLLIDSATAIGPKTVLRPTGLSGRQWIIRRLGQLYWAVLPLIPVPAPILTIIGRASASEQFNFSESGLKILTNF